MLRAVGLYRWASWPEYRAAGKSHSVAAVAIRVHELVTADRAEPVGCGAPGAVAVSRRRMSEEVNEIVSEHASRYPEIGDGHVAASCPGPISCF